MVVLALENSTAAMDGWQLKGGEFPAAEGVPSSSHFHFLLKNYIKHFFFLLSLSPC
jgi:hypothetical protein